jgi:hypothetical protein
MRGSRPRAPRDLRYEWAKPAKGSSRRSLLEWPAEGYIFLGQFVRPVLPPPLSSCHTPTPKRFRFIWPSRAKEVASGAHAILTLDGAGDLAAAALKTPDNITLLPLPSYSPEANPMENVGEYLRKNKLAITVYNDYDQVVDKSCEAWNFFADDKAAIA